ncbi:MAG: single-stranded DNA-binding protein [Deltaproteobacteria bacterium]
MLIGRLGKDPEFNYTPSGTPLAKFTLATHWKFIDKEGQKQEKTECHRIVVWRKLAEICGQYLAKGKQVMIEGRIEYGCYEKDGVKHYTTDIIAKNLEMLGGWLDGEPRQYMEPPRPERINEGNIPF